MVRSLLPGMDVKWICFTCVVLDEISCDKACVIFVHILKQFLYVEAPIVCYSVLHFLHDSLSEISPEFRLLKG